MQQLFEFIVRHWILCGAFVVLLVLIFIEEARAKGLGGDGVPVQALVTLINHEKQITLLDVRREDLFRQGHIANAINIPKKMFDKKDRIDRTLKKIVSLKTQKLVIICENGQQAMPVLTILRKQGFTDLCFLSGGIKSWVEASMPVVKK